MNSNSTAPASRRRIILLSSAFALVVAAIAIIVTSVTQSTENRRAAAPGDTVQVVRENSHVLDEAPGSTVTLVEFLDFECEACGAFYPYVEQLREDYKGEVTFVARYFPLPGHKNSQPAAVAVEAAAQQGKFEEMYGMMFETQADWGERQDSQAPLFRTYAESLGLDMVRFDAAVADPKTLERVLDDFTEGVELGITQTPTFFLNGEKMTIDSLDSFTDQIDKALAE